MPHGTDSFYNPNKGREESPTVIDWSKQANKFMTHKQLTKEDLEESREVGMELNRSSIEYIKSCPYKYCPSFCMDRLVSDGGWNIPFLEEMAKIPYNWQLHQIATLLYNKLVRDKGIGTPLH